MARREPIVVSGRCPGFWYELQGETLRVWTVNSESAEYEGSIEGVQHLYPVLWRHLLDIQAIRPA